MSAPVDVLAVLDEFVIVVGDEFGNAPALRLREARDAVAELIEAAISARSQLRAAAKELRWLSANQAMHCEAISDHVDAAISGVQGVQS